MLQPAFTKALSLYMARVPSSGRHGVAVRLSNAARSIAIGVDVVMALWA